MNTKLVLEHMILTRLASAIVTGCLLTTTGCVKIGHEVRYSEAGRALNRIEDPYYHSPQTGRIVMRPKKAAQYCYSEPAYYGFEATCWQRWPDGWVGCPCQEETIENLTPNHTPEQLPTTEAESSPHFQPLPPSQDPSTSPIEQPSPSDRSSHGNAPDPASPPGQATNLSAASPATNEPVPPSVENDGRYGEIATQIDLHATSQTPAPAPVVDATLPTQRRAARRNIPSLSVADARSEWNPLDGNESADNTKNDVKPTPRVTTYTAEVRSHPPDSPPAAITHLSDPLEEIDYAVPNWNARLGTTDSSKEILLTENESVNVTSVTPVTKRTEQPRQVTISSTPVPHPRGQAMIEPTVPSVATLSETVESEASVVTGRIVSDIASPPSVSELKFVGTQDKPCTVSHRWSTVAADVGAADLEFRVTSSELHQRTLPASRTRATLSAKPSHESKNEIRVR